MGGVKTLSAIATFCSALTLMACGTGGSTTTTRGSEGGATEEARAAKEPSKGPDASQSFAGSSGPPKVSVPQGPPPKKIVVEDLRRGRGPAAKPYSRLMVYFIGVDYETGKQVEAGWNPGRPFLFEYDHGVPMNGWEKGLAGMRAGGRRKVIVPSSLAYGQGAVVYVVDLLSVEDRSKYAPPRG